MKKKHIVITIITLIILFLFSIPTILIGRLIELNEIGSEAESVSDTLNLDIKQDDNTANLTFTELNGATSIYMEINDYNKLKLSSTLDEGQLRVKLIHGNHLWEIDIIEEILPSNSDSISIPLDIWDKNDSLGVWIIGDYAKEGSVDIELQK